MKSGILRQLDRQQEISFFKVLNDIISRYFTEAEKLRPAVLSEHWWSCILGLGTHSSNLVGKELCQLVSDEAER